MTLPVLAALARRAVLFVGCDTGPMHLAAAVGTPCVALYGPWPAEKHAPYGPQHVTVQKMCCQGSTRQRRKASSMYMEAIDVPSVCAACDQHPCPRRIRLNAKPQALAMAVLISALAAGGLLWYARCPCPAARPWGRNCVCRPAILRQRRALSAVFASAPSTSTAARAQTGDAT